MGLVAVASGLDCWKAGVPWWLAVLVGSSRVFVGSSTGLLSLYRPAPFVTTLGMLVDRTLAAPSYFPATACSIVRSGRAPFKTRRRATRWGLTFSLSYPLLFLIVLTANIRRSSIR